MAQRLAYHDSVDARSGRDLRIDLLRGFAVFAMVVDHLAGPSRLHALTGGNHFYTSAAEGFVFISGLMVGLVYRALAERRGLQAALVKLVERAGTLYTLAVGLVLVMLPISEVLKLPWATGVDLTDPAALLWSVVTLHRTYYLVDVPLLYALLLLVAPLALLLMHAGRTWLVLLLSWGLWAGYQAFPDQTVAPWPIAGNYLFQLAAWQVLFFTAMALGFHRHTVARYVPRTAYRPLLLLTGLAFAALVWLYNVADGSLAAASTHGLFGSTDLGDLLFAKADVRPGRLLASAVVFGFLFLLTTECWVPVRRLTAWLLLPLGQNALAAYAAHVVVALGLGLLATFNPWPLPTDRSSTINAAVQVAALLLLWWIIRLRLLPPAPREQRWWMAASVSSGLLVLGLVSLSGETTSQPANAELLAPSTAADLASLRAARRFGTPIPLGAAGVPEPASSGGAPEAPRSAGAPAPAVLEQRAARAPAQAADLPGVVPPVAAAVGPIQGSLREITFHSAALDRDFPYYAYLPPGYQPGDPSTRYPVLYMLHGVGGDGHRDEWVSEGLINGVDRMIQDGTIRPLIVVLPQGDTSHWVNHMVDGQRWGDYVWQDVVGEVDARLLTLPDPRYRAIGGLSTGAVAALRLGFTHPDVFSIVGAHSPTLREDDGSVPVFGRGADFAARDPISLASSAPSLDGLRIWIDMGEEDPWLARASVLHAALEARGVQHTWDVLPGRHEAAYWEKYLPNYLRFYDAALR